MQGPATTTQLLYAAAFACCAAPLPAQTQTQIVEIIGISPLPGIGVARDQVPANVQTASERDLRRLQSLNLPDLLGSQFTSVGVNEVQGNPYQLDVNYRGFSASPLLGTPQGLSVFQDGVRVNEPFGDIVNWDLIPRAALASITLLPGSNPLFGLNTLGGALALTTKSGNTHPGTEAEASAGGFGRRSVELAHGMPVGERGHVFVAASVFDEDGWRDASPSRVRQLFAKVGQELVSGQWTLGLTHGDNRLVGNGPLPETLLAVDRSTAYTRPDITTNRMTLATFGAALRPVAGVELSATLYRRDIRAATLNGDLNDGYDPPDVTSSGVENRTHSRQKADGAALQASVQRGPHRYLLGTAWDRSRSRFEQTAADGVLDAERTVVDAGTAEVEAKVIGRSRTRSAYAAAVLGIVPTLQLTLSARYNDTRVDTADVGRAELGLDTALDADARYRKLNPALGITWQATPALTIYGGASQGNRAPSPIELGCSDPEHACVLPNALQADPPLRQVVTRTVEGGVRGRFGDGLRWNVSAFHSVNHDDLLFIGNGRAAGYFTNFGRTQRQGAELGLAQRGPVLDWTLSYSLLRAVFDSSACLLARSNSSAGSSAACSGDGEIEVRPGNRLPGLPRHAVKAGVDWRAGAGWRLGAQFNAYSSQTARGNENQAQRPDGEQFSGSGRIGGYALLNLTAAWQFARRLELFGKVGNVFDRRYASAARLGVDAFGADGALRAPSAWRNEQFDGPGAPRAAWIGLRFTLADD